MLDTYYADLARSVLNDALGKLQTVQEYMIQANLPETHVKRVQRSITSLRFEIDTIANLEIMQRNDNE